MHEECEIYVNLSGDVSFEVENGIYPVSRGSVIITRPYEYHHCIYHSDKPHEHFWITFSAQEDEEFLQLFFRREKGKNNLIVLDESQLRELCAVLNALLSNEADPLLRRIYFLQTMHILCQGTGASSTSYVDNLPQDVAAALLYMDEHLSEDLSMETVATVCNVSLNTLERHFKEAMGLSPFATLRRKRLIASLEHLRKGDSVAECAYKCGFSDYSNYIQLFRKQFGLTPLQYKKKFVSLGGNDTPTPRQA